MRAYAHTGLHRAVNVTAGSCQDALYGVENSGAYPVDN